MMRNFGATVAGRYGSKAMELLLLSVAMRRVDAAEIGIVFFAQAAGSLAYKAVDAGLFPVLSRRSAREELGRGPIITLFQLRLIGVVVLTALFGLVTTLRRPETAAITTGFFLIGGIMVLHEIPRSVLAGDERFELLAKLNLATKALEVAIAVAGLLGGFGLWAWLIGRAVGQAALLLLAWPRALGGLPPAFGPPGPRALIREGIPFWLTNISGMVSSRLGTVVVSLWVSFEATAQLGVATRVVGAATGIVGAMTSVAYPSLARERRRFVTRSQVVGLLGVSLLLGLPIFVAAPFIVSLIVGHPDPATITVVRIVTPVISMNAMSRPLATWLQAKQKERSLLIISIFNAMAGTALVLALVPTLGLWGAAMAWPLRGVVEVLTTGLLTFLALRGARAALPSLLSLLPGGKASLRRLAPGIGRRVSRRLGEVPGVEAVLLAGSAIDEPRFRPGISSFDVTVLRDPTSDSSRADIESACRRQARNHPLARPLSLKLSDRELLMWSLRLGTPALEDRWGEAVVGDLPATLQEAEHGAASALQSAIEAFARMQRAALEHSRNDDAVRAAALLEPYRHVIFYAARAGAPEDTDSAFASCTAYERLSNARSTERPVEGWLEAEEVGLTFASASRWLELAALSRIAGWEKGQAGDEGARLGWLDEVDATVRARAERLADALGADGVELSPTGPVEGDPILLVGHEGVSRPEGVDLWRRWLRLAASSPPLPAPFRGYPRELLLPPALLEADAFFEHAPLFHAARRDHAIALSGRLPAGRVPPEAHIREAALRSTLRALLRVDEDIDRLERSPEREAPPRVRALLRARLAALDLAMDEGLLLSTVNEVTSRYAARNDDPLAEAMAMERPRAGDAAEALRFWARARRAAMREKLGTPD